MVNTTFVFIIGVPRSGTSWLYEMISAHDDVFSLNGSNTFLHQYIFPLEEKYNREKQIFTDRGFSRGIPSKLSKNEFEKLISDYIRRFYDFLPEKQQYYVEKATDITSELHKIRKYIPNSKFIHIIRDGRNSTISRIKNRIAYGRPFGVSDVYEGAIGWKQQIEEARQNSSEFSSDILEVRYEDLLNNPEHYLGKIFQHIGLIFEQQTISNICNKFHHKTKLISNPNSSIVNSDGKPAQVYEIEMSKVNQALFEYLAGDLLKSLDYKNENLLNNRIFLIYIKYFKLPVYFAKKRFSVILNGLIIKLKRIISTLRNLFS